MQIEILNEEEGKQEGKEGKREENEEREELKLPLGDGEMLKMIEKLKGDLEESERMRKQEKAEKEENGGKSC